MIYLSYKTRRDDMKSNNWHSISVSDVYKKLESSELGLTNKEAHNRILKYGKNVLPKEKKDGFFKI